MLWSVYVLWRDPDAVDFAYMGFMFTLAVLVTWYWSRQPVSIVVSDRYTHSAHATGVVRFIPSVPRYTGPTWTDLAHLPENSKEVLEAEG